MQGKDKKWSGEMKQWANGEGKTQGQGETTVLVTHLGGECSER